MGIKCKIFQNIKTEITKKKGDLDKWMLAKEDNAILFIPVFIMRS